MSARFRHGLVVGKLYPPHLGHHHLIDEAAAACERVTVVITASATETIPLADRVAWTQATHAGQPDVRVVGAADDYPVDYGDDDAWAAHVAVFADAVARAAIVDGLPPEGAVVDAVFTSEPYGEELARRFGATAVCVDLERDRHPCSGTAARADLAGHWHQLAGPARAGLALRVVFLGAESTGTTTVSQIVAERLGADWVPEYGRDHTIAMLAAAGAQAAAVGDRPPGMDDLRWRTEDFVEIARRQVELEDAAAATGGPVLICDTDAFATGVWHERYLGTRSPEVEAWADARPHPLYLLTSHQGVPFVQDGIRDGEHLRSWMTERFVEALSETGRTWRILTGPVEQRVTDALSAIELLCATTPLWRFAEPLKEVHR